MTPDIRRSEIIPNEVFLEEARKIVVDRLMPDSFAILKKHFESKNFRVDSKGGYVDIVTEADIENESFLRETLLKNFPQTQFLGEETATEGTGTP